MTIRELGNECKKYKRCSDCPYISDECDKFEDLLENIVPCETSPCDFLAMLNRELN